MLTIPQTLQLQADAASQRVESLRTPGRLLISGLLAGAYIGVGVVLMVCAAGPLIAAGDGLSKLVAGVVFGVALTLVVFAGADLATSAMMVLPQGILMKRVAPGRAVSALITVFVFNLAGSLLFSAIVAISGVIDSNPPAAAMLSDLLAGRAAQSPIELFARGILCNLLVCLAIWMGARVRSEVGKIALIFVSITAFVASGFEHVVANMTIYGLGLMTGDPNATLVLFGGNLLWVGLGNLVGGGLIVGVGYWVIGGRPRAQVEEEVPLSVKSGS